MLEKKKLAVLKHKAFTLAEVLITLAIIGIIAALTLPLVIKNYQKHAAAVRLKKTYNVIAQGYACRGSRTWRYGELGYGVQCSSFDL